ncbi:helix-turn-helix domain-containing protein [Specibacter sp. RAF43]|uniref:helix-turn-helix domain-containing protein n=1 Tax=Specibacter sp. RAF43 TaxID=3233057 RepID=UPI003F971C88
MPLWAFLSKFVILKETVQSNISSVHFRENRSLSRSSHRAGRPNITSRGLGGLRGQTTAERARNGFSRFRCTLWLICAVNKPHKPSKPHSLDACLHQRAPCARWPFTSGDTRVLNPRLHWEFSSTSCKVEDVKTTNQDPRLAAVASALVQADEAKLALSSAIKSAAASGLSCARIAAGVGLTRNQIEYRGFQDIWPSFRNRPTLKSPRETVPPGVVRPAEAARILHVSRTTVYARLRTGALPSFTTQDGRQMVYLGSLQCGEQN